MRAFLTFLMAALAACSAPSAAAELQGLYAITDVTVVPMDRERHIPGQTVIVRDGRIELIGPTDNTLVPRGAIRIEGRGRYLMPGLAEMHAHVPPNPQDRQWSDDVLFLYVANGITFARSMLGAPHHIPLRDAAERGEIVSPRLYLSGPSFNGDSVASPEAARRMVAEQKAAGYDFLKIHPGLDRPRYDAMAEAADAAGIRFAGHVPEAVGIARALEAKQATIDHLDGYMAFMVSDGTPTANAGFFGMGLADNVDHEKAVEAVRLTREAGVWNVPTDSLMHHVLLPGMTTDQMTARPEMRYVPREMLASWVQARNGIQSDPGYNADRARRFVEGRGRFIKALNDSGAGLLLGSDSPQFFNVPGFALHRELAYMVEAGLTPYQALAMGTRNVSQFLGTPDAFGTVEAGRRADLLLLEADPLADVANVSKRAGVMLNGRWLPEDRLQAGLAAIAARYKS